MWDKLLACHSCLMAIMTGWKPIPLSDAGGIRTRNREGLSFAAVPVRVPRRHQWCEWDLNPQTLRFELSRYAS